MTRLRLMVFFVLLAALATASAKEKSDHLDFTVEKDWMLANSTEASGVNIMEFIREDDTLQNWKELVTIQNFRKPSSPRSPKEFLNKLKALREKECPGVTEWNVVDQKEDSVLYEWHAEPCLGQAGQSELGRIIYGKFNVFILHYAAKGLQFPPNARELWIKNFNAASIVDSR